jgi:hypothetical protein
MEGRQERVEPLDRAHDLVVFERRSRRQSHGVIAQCNSALCLEPPNPAARPTLICNDQPAQVRRRDLLGGLLHEYQ